MNLPHSMFLKSFFKNGINTRLPTFSSYLWATNTPGDKRIEMRSLVIYALGRPPYENITTVNYENKN